MYYGTGQDGAMRSRLFCRGRTHRTALLSGLSEGGREKRDSERKRGTMLDKMSVGARYERAHARELQASSMLTMEP